MYKFHNQELQKAHETISDWVRSNMQFCSVRNEFYFWYIHAIAMLTDFENDLRNYQEEQNE